MAINTCEIIHHTCHLQFSLSSFLECILNIWRGILAFCWVFWLNIAKFKVNWCYRYCFKLFSNLRKEKELRQYHCRNSPKVGERKIKSRREKFFIFGNSIVTIDLRSGLGNRNFGNVITEIQNFLSPAFSLSLSYFCWISATPLPKFTLFPQFPK